MFDCWKLLKCDIARNGKKISWVDKISNKEVLAKVEDREIKKSSSRDNIIGLTF